MAREESEKRVDGSGGRAELGAVLAKERCAQGKDAYRKDSGWNNEQSGSARKLLLRGGVSAVLNRPASVHAEVEDLDHVRLSLHPEPGVGRAADAGQRAD